MKYPDAPCPSCESVDRRGYCAPLRCYCGHDDCHAAASYVRLAWRLPDEEAP